MDIVTQTDLETVRALKALADETRFEIVRMLCRQPMCGGDLLERFPSPSRPFRTTLRFSPIRGLWLALRRARLYATA